jgi:nicotinate-nucleotide pyrophosphorylase (carboxylating)
MLNLYIESLSNLVKLAVEEDLGAPNYADGDTTSRLTIPPNLQGQAAITLRSRGVLAGIDAAEMVFRTVDKTVAFQKLHPDGQQLESANVIARVHGSMRSILAAERTALNFLQHLSGVATLTRKYVDAVAGLTVQILHTRKTIPGLRYAQIHAVLCGGGHPHRDRLSDALLIKDNHLAALQGEPDPISAAVKSVRGRFPALPVEVEVDTFAQLERAFVVNPDIILLDNMTPEQMREAVRRRNAMAPKVLLEASGGVNLQTVRAIAETGVDRISVGALTHSAPALDIGLDYERPS